MKCFEIFVKFSDIFLWLRCTYRVSGPCWFMSPTIKAWNISAHFSTSLPPLVYMCNHHSKVAVKGNMFWLQCLYVSCYLIDYAVREYFNQNQIVSIKHWVFFYGSQHATQSFLCYKSRWWAITTSSRILWFQKLSIIFVPCSHAFPYISSSVNHLWIDFPIWVEAKVSILLPMCSLMFAFLILFPHGAQ